MKYIALDIGNVICYADLQPFVNKISKTFNVTIAEASAWLRSFQQIHDLGLTTMAQQLKLNFNCRSEATITELENIWSNQIQPCYEMLHMLDDMGRKDNVKVALLSNIGVEHAAQMQKKLKPLIDHAITHFSCDVGARKPTKLYYQSFLMEYPEFKGCLYVDDLPENLETGVNLGFRPHHFDLSKEFPSSYTPNIRKIKEIILNGSKSTDI